MVIFQILLLNDKRVISKERNTVRASNPRASLTWTDNTSKAGYVISKCKLMTAIKDCNTIQVGQILNLQVKSLWF